MAKREKKEFTCTVVVTEGFSDRLTRALVDIYYKRQHSGKTEKKEKKDEVET